MQSRQPCVAQQLPHERVTWLRNAARARNTRTLRLGPHDTARIHGANERIGVHEYEDAIRCYRNLIRGAA